jgi:DNA polymerase-4
MIFHLDVDAFFASAEQSFNPFLRGKPVIVGGDAEQRGVVHSASYEARAFGVRTGMVLREAGRLCPQAIFLKGDFLRYKYISQEILKILLTFSPLVEFTSLDDAYIDMTGTGRRFTEPRQAAEEIQRIIDARLCVPVSIGIGSSRLISRMASGRHKPRGITFVPPGKELEFLHPLPISELLGVGRVTKTLLCEMGIQTIGQLAKIPKHVLQQLLGANGVKIWEYANGIDGRQVLRFRRRRQISRETTFEEDTADGNLVLATLQYLGERIAAKLREERIMCRTVHVRIRYSDAKSKAISRKLPACTQDPAMLNAMVQQLYEQIRRRRTRVRFVHVSVSNMEPENWQPEFFAADTKQKNLTESIDQIRKRFGFTALMSAESQILKTKYRMDKHGYILHTPSLSQ